eukprot:scaffold2858_cov83-Skeletonema_marinoi.AAC.2
MFLRPYIKVVITNVLSVEMIVTLHDCSTAVTTWCRLFEAASCGLDSKILSDKCEVQARTIISSHHGEKALVDKSNYTTTQAPPAATAYYTSLAITAQNDVFFHATPPLGGHHHPIHE